MRNMTKRRRALMASSHNSKLPDEYQEVEWLADSNSAYCVTSFNVQYNSEIKTEIKGDLTLTNYNAKLWLGASWTGNPGATYGIEVRGRMFEFGYGRTSPYNEYKEIEIPSTVYPIDIHYELNANNLKLNNETYSRSSYQFTGNHPICIGTFDASQAGIQNESVNIKAFSIYNGVTGQLISEIIPCYRKSDNKPGFYQTNPPSGSDNFIYYTGHYSDWLVGPIVN